MTQQEIVRKIEQLPLHERWEIIEQIAHNARQAGQVPSLATPQVDRAAAVDRLHGAVRWEGSPPNDEEVDQMRYDYLMKKHA